MARTFLTPSFILTALAFAKVAFASPNYPNKFTVPLPIPQVLEPLASYTPPNGAASVDFYEMEIKSFNKPIWPGLASTPMVGYNGQYPGPTIRATRGKECVIRYTNNGNAHAAIHLHGSATVAPFDGWASDIIEVGQYKDYYYPNFQDARTLWYHDHAHNITAQNVRNGQAGLYILEDPEAEAGLDLPQGAYDVPLVLASKTYNNDGTLGSATGQGDTIEVNGQLWPFLAVEPRKYRFRMLDASAVRTFNVQLFRGSETTNPIPLNVIASDAGFLQNTVATNAIRISMGERYEFVVDFANFAGQTLSLRNSDGSSLSSATLGWIMQFQVGNTVSDTTNNNLPTALRTIDFLPVPSTAEKSFVFANTNGRFTINGVSFSDVNNRVLNHVPRGTTEVWTLSNPGGGVHPVHIHLVDFQVLSRSTNGVSTPLQAYEVQSLKDIVILNGQETVRVLARYAPWDGLYMFHCHNLAHEDAEMMAVFNVTALADFGYPETTRFTDPMDARWQAKAITGPTNPAQIEAEVLPAFKALQAYDDIDGLMEALEEFHNTR